MKQFSFLFFIIVLSFSQTSTALANANKNQGNNQSAASELRVKNAQQAAQIVKARYGGKVLKVSKSGSKTKIKYRVKLVKKNGHVISVTVNAKTGQILGNP